MNPFEERQEQKKQVWKSLFESSHRIVAQNPFDGWLEEIFQEPPFSWAAQNPDKEAQLIYERLTTFRQHLLDAKDTKHSHKEKYNEACEVIDRYLPVIDKHIAEFEQRSDVKPEIRLFGDDPFQLKDAEIQVGKYGIHQDKEQWVKSHFEYHKTGDISDNKAAEMVQRDYQNTFGQSISPSTIKRYAGVVSE